jgi:tetratricopeptide (TPR) repeat protein
LALARRLAAAGRDDEAKSAYVALLRAEPGHASALVELAALALAGGHVSAARTAYAAALAWDPSNSTAQIGFANLLRNDGALEQAYQHYQAALAASPTGAIQAAANQGLAAVFEAWGNHTLAALHRQLGFTGHAVVSRPFRKAGQGTPLLLLVSARNGNIPVQGWIDDQHFAVTAIYTEFFNPAAALPPHALIVNAIGDAECCADALDAAQAILARSTAPVINPPNRVKATSRANNARRLGCLPGVVTPKTRQHPRAKLLDAKNLEFPLLARAPGFHTGQHFVRVENRQKLTEAIAAMPDGDILTIQYLDARGPDGMARKYLKKKNQKDFMTLGLGRWPSHNPCPSITEVFWFFFSKKNRLPNLASFAGRFCSAIDLAWTLKIIFKPSRISPSRGFFFTIFPPCCGTPTPGR